MKVEHKMTVAFAIALLALALVGTATYLNARKLVERNAMVVHTYRVISAIDRVFSTLDEIESGARGFLLSGKQEFLQPYHTGLNTLRDGINELHQLTGDNPVQQSAIERLQSLSNRAVANVHQEVLAFQGRADTSVLPSLGLEDKVIMDQVRFVTATMKGQENQLLEERDRQASESARRTVTNFGLLLLLAVVLLVAIFGFIRHDLSERRRNDKALRASDTKFRAVMDGAPDALLITDAKGQIQMVNSQAEKLFGYTRGEFTDHAMDDLVVAKVITSQALAHDPSDRLTGDPALQEFRSAGARFDGVRKDGTTFPLDLSRNPMQVGGEHLLISAVRDRTEQEHAAEALQKFSLDLARSNAELEKFAYVASHDLQEPLRMVSSYTQLLAKRYKGKLDANADEFISYAVDGASRMQRLINDLLALSRVGTQAKPSEPVEVGAVLKRVLADLQPAIESAQATVTVPQHPPTVMADSTQVGQLFQNLVGNALKFKGDQPPAIQIQVRSTHGGAFWEFAVQDNGIGIEPQYFERIFVIFQRLHSKESYAGTGIGLAICKKIVERHGGTLWVESQVGRGTTFYFTLPTAAVS